MHALTASTLADVFRIDAFRSERDGAPVIVPWTAA
jgi:hypothetical protein